MKNVNVTQLDHKQFTAKMYDEQHDAQRVIIVGNYLPNSGETVQILPQNGNSEQILPKNREIQVVNVPEIVHQLEVREISVPVIIKQTEVIEVEKTVIVKEYERIEIPVITESVKIVEIEKPVYETRVERIEVPVVVQTPAEFPKIVKILLVANLVGLVLLNLLQIIKK